MLLRYFYIQQQWRLNVQAESEARLKVLQARIRPHFLFNSMNTIASLIFSQPRQAEQVVLDLADLFRAGLRQRDTISLSEELALARGYLSIEAARLGDRLRINWRLADDLPLDLQIPPLVLQPLLENAVFHGIEPSQNGGVIDIVIVKDQRRRLVIEISNSLPDQAKACVNGYDRQRGHRIAQENIRQRLALAYPEEGTMDIVHNQQRYRVTLTVPL